MSEPTFPTTNCQTRTASPADCRTSRDRTRWFFTFRAGGVDPKEHRFLRHMVDAHLDFRVAYTRVVVISTDDQLGINEFRDSVGAQFPFLADPQRTVQKDFDIVEYTDPVHDPMIPHTFVLAPALKISVIYNGYWYLGRPTVASPYRHSDKRANYLHSGQNINAEWAGEVCCGSSRDSTE
jgi:hypothetical protein